MELGIFQGNWEFELLLLFPETKESMLKLGYFITFYETSETKKFERKDVFQTWAGLF